jgi:hypothetical protein
MKTLLATLSALAATAAQAHDSLVPHTHPHGMSMLPDFDSFIVGGIFAIAAALMAYAKFGARQ